MKFLVASQPYGKQSGKQNEVINHYKPQKPIISYMFRPHATGRASYYTNPTFRNSKITQPIAHNHQRNIKKSMTSIKIKRLKQFLKKKKKINLGIIVFPDPASNLMTPQIESLKLDLPNAQFLRSGVLGRLMLN